jgi:aspartate 1-decarboxylase
MMRRLVRAVIRQARITGNAPNLRVDPLLLRAANLLPLEEVEILNEASGERIVTFAEAAAEGEVSAPHMRIGDVVSLVSYGLLHDGQTLNHRAVVVTVGDGNVVLAIEEAGP